MRSTFTRDSHHGFGTADSAVLDLAYRRIMARHPINCSVPHNRAIDKTELAEIEKSLEDALAVAWRPGATFEILDAALRSQGW
jgi:hypothetical protein